MKNSKKIMIMLLALLMMMLSAIPVSAASVYTPVHPTTISPKVHLTVSGSEPHVVPNLTYTFKVAAPLAGYSEGGVNFYYPADVTANASVFTAGQVLGTTAFTPSDPFNSGTTVEKSFAVDLSGLTFTQPGIYYLTIEKTASGAAAGTASNNNETHYIWIRVEDVLGTLTVTSVRATTDAAGTHKLSYVEDSYPASKDVLTIGKTVSGPMGSKDRYFKFTVNITGLSAIAGSTLAVVGDSSCKTATLYYGETIGATDHPATITVSAGGEASAVFWLKNGESVTIEGLLAGAAYTVVEEAANTEGYVTTYSRNSGAPTAYTTGITGTISTSTASVYTVINERTSSVPTGVWLQTAAPVFGIVVAAGLFAILLIVKRRRKNEASC